MEYSVYLVDSNLSDIKETERIIRENVSELKIVGFNTDAKAAFLEIISLKPDIVVFEWIMPQIDGINLMRKIKRTGYDCAFILLTRAESFTAVRELFTSGGIDYWMKPLELKTIYEGLRRVDNIRNGRPVYS
jgi:response regulator of citrate/malate metabolism